MWPIRNWIPTKKNRNTRGKTMAMTMRDQRPHTHTLTHSHATFIANKTLFRTLRNLMQLQPMCYFIFLIEKLSQQKRYFASIAPHTTIYAFACICLTREVEETRGNEQVEGGRRKILQFAYNNNAASGTDRNGRRCRRRCLGNCSAVMRLHVPR